MPTNYKTPGVYVEEISVFPPSVAPVETAIPAFIGYTEYAIKNGEEIKNTPTRISSFVEFRQFFGGAPRRDVIIRLDTQNQFVKTERDNSVNEYYLFDALRLFYDNGGGDCYIVSVGYYNTAPDIGDANTGTGILGGLKKLEKYDEPTIILSPDAALLGGDAMYTYQQQALAHCAKLQDRFFIGDLLKNNERQNGETFDERVSQVRDKIGINHLKYGALYAPYLKTTLSANLRFRDVFFARVNTNPVNTNSSNSLLFSITSDQNIINLINDLSNVKEHVDTLKILINIENDLQGLIDDYNSFIIGFDDAAPVDDTADWTNIGNSGITDLYTKIIEVLLNISSVYNQLSTGGATGDFNLIDDIDNLVVGLDDLLIELLTHQRQVLDLSNPDVELFTIPSFTNIQGLFGISGDATNDDGNNGGIDSITSVEDLYTSIASTTPNRDRIELAANAAKSIINQISILYNGVLTATKNYEKTFDDALKSTFGTYKTLLSRADQALMVLPPSAAIAGIYTAVDNERGVWKAPANVSLNSVSGPYVNITTKEQEDLNVDVNAGKSINAIRAFTGKGTLVWGARTLAGNDNEWRYVSVRRFFNYAEESIKKASEQFVFEPNDANTWVRVRSMIENFLTNEWRAGALAGSKPEQAFFVRIGLGETMTAVDILEGRMIVEIGMAVVRPAEFIILRFSHKMQES